MNNTITRIQLIPTAPEFISGYLDVDQRVPVPINYAISDIRDPQKRTGSFSKTITIPGTKNNNKLLSQLFEINVAEGPFSVKKLYRCILLQDGIPLHENELSLQLISVNKIQNQLNEDDIIEYNVVVRDDVAQFFSEVANKKLSDIDFTDLTHNINPGTIISSFTNTWVDGYKYLLPFKEQSNFYDFFEAIPSIYAKVYWDRLHADAGFQYEFFNNVEPQNFDRLIIPSNRKIQEQIEILKEENKVVVNRITPQTFTFSPTLISGAWIIGDWPGAVQNFQGGIFYTNIIQDILNSFTLPNTWSPQIITSNNYKVSIQFDYRYLINNTGGTPINVFTSSSQGNIFSSNIAFNKRLTGGPGSPSFGIIGVADNSLIQQSTSPPPSETYNPGQTQAAQNVVQRYSDSFFIPNTLVGQTWQSFLLIQLVNSLQSADFFQLQLEIFNVSLVIEIDANTLILNQPIDMNVEVPDMTQSDFLRSIYTMYNLYVVPDKINSNKLIYYTRDDFYRNGSTKDWTYKLDRGSEQILEFLPELRNKELLLTYKEDDDVVNEFYTSFTQEIYGQKNTIFNIEWTKGVDKKELSFSPTPGSLSNFGHFLPYIQRENNPRILLDNGIKAIPLNPINIVSSYTTQNLPISTGTIFYPFASHFNNTRNPTFDINFGENPYYFYDIGLLTLNNLYNQFWRNTIQLIEEGKMLTAYFYLTPTDIYDLELNDVIRIDNSYWNINKIIDYDAGDRRLTKVELITNSELLPLPIIPDSDIEEGEEPGEE
jgi:hypothetical protein